MPPICTRYQHAQRQLGGSSGRAHPAWRWGRHHATLAISCTSSFGGRPDESTHQAGALLGLIGVAVGLRWADGVAGLIVTGFIVHVGRVVTSELFVHLMHGVDPDVLAVAETAPLSVPGVEHVHIRGRWMGRSPLLEVEGFVPAASTVEAAEGLGRDVEAAVIPALPESREVLWSPRSLPGVSY